MEQEKHTLYTESGYKALVDELEYLKGAKMQEVKEALAAARAFGDLSENSEYDEAKNEQSKVVTRIQELEKLINEAVIINENEIQADIVNIGAVVRVMDYDLDEEVEYSIVGSNEANSLQGKISDQSPIGNALIGTRVGDEVTVEAPGGILKFKVLSVHRPKTLS